MGSPSGTKSIRLRETEEHNREKLHHSLDLTAGSNISQKIVLITSAALYNIDRARLDSCGITGKKIYCRLAFWSSLHYIPFIFRSPPITRNTRVFTRTSSTTCARRMLVKLGYPTRRERRAGKFTLKSQTRRLLMSLP